MLILRALVKSYLSPMVKRNCSLEITHIDKLTRVLKQEQPLKCFTISLAVYDNIIICWNEQGVRTAIFDREGVKMLAVPSFLQNSIKDFG